MAGLRCYVKLSARFPQINPFVFQRRLIIKTINRAFRRRLNCFPDASVASNDCVTVMGSASILAFFQDENQVVQPLSSGKMAILGNFFACEGKSGPVLEIKAAKRSGQENFVTCMQKGLAARYPGISIGIGGVFLVPKGKVNIHVMV